MNERIRELVQEAIDYADKTHTYTPEEGFNIQEWDKIRLETFAELIVRECAKIAFQNDIAKFTRDGYRIGLDIQKHFGVEE